jgi:broad specificity phosphatase PhoE
MKWVEYLILIRHAESMYNVLKKTKFQTPIFKTFILEYEKDPHSKTTIELAEMVRDHFKNEPAMNLGDARGALCLFLIINYSTIIIFRS